MRNLIQSALPAACALLCSIALPAVAQRLQVQSPDARTQVEFSLRAGGVPTYRVLYRNKVVLDDAPLGLDLGRSDTLGKAMTLQGSTTETHDSRFALPVGKTRQARDHYRQLRVQLSDPKQRRLTVELRAYDDGVALRYVLPDAGEVRIRNELTGFAFPGDYACWSLNLGRFGTSHEGEYDAIAASRLRPHNLLELPLVCQTDASGTTLAIAEANLRDYAGLYLTGREDGSLGVSAKLSPRLDDPTLAVSFDAKGRDFATPWRVIMLGDSPASLIESNLISALNPPPAFDASWVRAGKSAWDWWSGSLASGVAQPGMNTATIQRYIDHAQQLKLQYMLIDDGWYFGSTGDGQYNVDADIRRPVEQLDLPGLVAYARQRDVGLWLWAHWRALDAHMDEALAWYQQLGIKGIKVDFMDRDDQQMVDFYHRLLAKRRAQTAGGSAWRLSPDRPDPHLSQLPHAGRRARRRVQQVDHPHHRHPQSHAAVYAHVARADGLHTGWLPQCAPGRVQDAAHRAAGDDYACAATGDVCGLRKPVRGGRRQPGTI
ncbi:alpha-glucosidase [Xanthomonas arboricola pv. pruni str. MAFF 311562]|uniref:Alpha-glucosidase n=1 Tax=Xanthomonas arboricola pv. pruni str. MAFF 311562 TaxID=1414836 RepID=W4S2F8_9XANT|nr:alpha-glucosidase [Xanthomonas arboricola pv. pruni str. MAFF 311562]